MSDKIDRMAVKEIVEEISIVAENLLNGMNNNEQPLKDMKDTGWMLGYYAGLKLAYDIAMHQNEKEIVNDKTDD